MGAKSGKLAVWVGGDENIFNAHKKVLDAFSDAARYIGPIGAGSVAKLVHNCAGYGIQMVLAEVFSMGIKAGVEPLALWEAVRTGASGRQRTFDRLHDRFLQNKFDPPSFALKLGHKDMRLATELGRELGVPMRLANMPFAEMTEALNRGWGNRDSRSPQAASARTVRPQGRGRSPAHPGGSRPRSALRWRSQTRLTLVPATRHPSGGRVLCRALRGGQRQQG